MRVENWHNPLAQFVESRINTPFEWGVNDCVTFAAEAIERMTGVNPIPEAVGDWSDEVGALRALRELGGMEAALESAGFQEVHPAFAQQGDLVLVDCEGRDTAAICMGTGAAAPSKDGLVLLPMSDARRAWRV